MANDEATRDLIACVRGNAVHRIGGAVERGADVDAKVDGLPLVHVAVLKGHIEVVRKLAWAGADIDEPDERGNTALMLAAELSSGRAQCRMVELLVECGADVSCRNEQTGRNAIDLAVRAGNRHAAEMLNRAGAEPTSLERASEFGYLIGRVPRYGR